MTKQTKNQQQKTQGKTTKDNDNKEQIQTQDKELLSLKDGLQPTRHPLKRLLNSLFLWSVREEVKEGYYR